MKTIVLVVYWCQLSGGGQERLFEDVLFKLNPDGTTNKSRVTSQDSFWGRGIANTETLKGTEFSVGMVGGKRVGVRWEWSKIQILLDQKIVIRKSEF